MASSSSSSANQSQVPTFYCYPQALARYQDVVASSQLFMDTLGKLHAAMGTKFMIPIIGGKDLKLHHLFVEVTSRGGIQKVLREKKWKEVTTTFNFPPSATNASFILRKYYMSLLHHYEQVYYFGANSWTPVSADAWQNMHSAPSATRVLEAIQPSAEFQVTPAKQHRLPPVEMVTPAKRLKIDSADSPPQVIPETLEGSQVTGIIDGKFESGYLVTMVIGSEQVRGVIYLTPQDAACQNQELPPQYQTVNKSNMYPTTVTSASGVKRRRRRKKSEMKKRDPAHPKPNRSGYNFFFAEQHARLKPLHPGKDRDISRMIGELWNNLNESQRSVYQEKALRDKERYRIEMLQYKENIRVGQMTSNMVLAQQQQVPLDLDINVEEGGGSPQTLENELTSGKSYMSDSEEYDETENETVDDQGLFEMEKGDLINIGEGGIEMGAKEELPDGLEEDEEEEDSQNVEEEKSVSLEGEVENESVPLTTDDGAKNELTSEDIMTNGFNPEVVKETACPEEKVELVAKDSVAAIKERVENEDVDGISFDLKEKDLAVNSKELVDRRRMNMRWYIQRSS